MHIPPYNNKNIPIIDTNNSRVPFVYFNNINLTKNKIFISDVIGYETCFVPVTGTFSVNVGNLSVKKIGKREKNVWDNDPEGIYIPLDEVAEIKCLTEKGEGFIAGAKYNQKLKPFMVTQDEIDIVQYGSDDTKTHRKIKHILGQKQSKSVGRLLVSELYTVGQGGWSGFPPHKHDTDIDLKETKHDEVYNFRFNPSHGFGMQLLQNPKNSIGEASHIVDGSTFIVDKGYHPCVVAPGYEMYYFTILAGKSQRPLVQYFQPEHAWQIETIPGIKDMIAKFK
jgi:5-deoxy-glucuronate isomerase